LASAAAFATGRATAQIVKQRRGISEDNIRRHENAAKITAAATYPMGLAAIASLFLMYRAAQNVHFATAITLFLSLAASVLQARTVVSGRRIRRLLVADLPENACATNQRVLQ